jgi:hypothetical protein
VEDGSDLSSDEAAEEVVVDPDPDNRFFKEMVKVSKRLPFSSNTLHLVELGKFKKTRK